MRLSFLKSKVKAAILPTVVTLSLLITIMVSGIIMIAYYKTTYLLNDEIKERLMLNALSGINYILANEKDINKPISLALYETEKDSVLLQKKPWGLFDVGLSIAQLGRHIERKAVLYGVTLDKYGRSALYLTDENRPLSLSGNTLIKGTAYLPKAGLRTAYINQESFTRKKLIEGTVKESQSTIPPLNKEIAERIELKGLLASGIEKDNLENIKNSFLNDTYILKGDSNLTLENTFLINNMVIYAPYTLTIENTAHLSNIIVSAGKVIIKEGFKGDLQVFAKDTIIVEKDVELKYPSSLIAYGKSNHSRIEIHEGSVLEGIVVIPENEAEFLGNLLRVNKGATIQGQAYVGGLVDIQGTLEGSLICRRFFLKTPSTLYENHLLDATIDNSKLSPYFITSSLLSSSEKKYILKWLD